MIEHHNGAPRYGCKSYRSAHPLSDVALRVVAVQEVVAYQTHPQLLHLHSIHPALAQEDPKANQDIPSPLSQRDPLGP